ncbi:hypothetical protein FA15DRAFT_706253 [Coprinopsis marcescibilis]|uniref:Uncharacterized protein n=1 Tax=Coprinopsis marcescibilis TaxID=230819 RepID=A0A5C3KQC3_COPMA|nr:hypothetical protein FA15DRAFT_706253 [Coprinopsis marcescibilis]
MSYASVAAHNAPPQDEWPQPDQALLNTISPTASSIVDDASKINVVSSDFKEHPRSTYEEKIRGQAPLTTGASSEPEEGESKKPRHNHHQERLPAFWQRTTDWILRPGVAGGLLGIVNVGLIAGAGYSFFARPQLRRDPALLGGAAVSAFSIMLAEGYLSKQYVETPEGQRRVRRVKNKGSALARWIDECVHEPTVQHALVATVNAAVAGTVGYLTYRNWDRPWNHRSVSAIVVGVLGLAGLDGYVLEKSNT